jgi:cysteine synthase A
MAKYDDILGTIGNTPVVRLTRLAPGHVRLFAKLEAFNPMGSVKDRLALGIIEDAERTGELRPGQTVIEATSGNTGIGLAMVCAHKGYPLVVTMSEAFSVERRKLMRFLGAKVVLTPASLRGSGMLSKAVELAERHGWFFARQFENEANADVHSRTTARELLADFEGERLDCFVTGVGTGGTLKGVARVLREARPETRIIVCEPDNAPLLASGIPQPRTASGEPAASHPSSRPHLMQGWTPDFVPRLAEDAVAMGLIDQIVPVGSGDAMRWSRELARREGICTGITGGATLAGALQVCASAPDGATIVCLLPDTGERYLSTLLFEDVPADMTEEELAISRSTPSSRFDAPAPAPTPQPAPQPAQAPPAPPQASAEAVAFVEAVVGDPAHPVTMFSLEWCEFCMVVRKLFARAGIPYRSIDLDSVEYRTDNRDQVIRAALAARTSMVTIPQIFIGGVHVGGATDAVAAWKQGRLQALLAQARVSFDASADVDPDALLPGWLHPR